ncbi:MAG: glycosyltransferase family 4 protein [Rhizobiaceae bacterium]|nr:glycosyltransferase family 4 protein [Rhizobiaceae bacterium]
MTKPAIAYYAPLKPPDHPIPSGDRQMARMLLAALNKAGYDAQLASRYISYSKRHGPQYLEERKQGALEEAATLLARWEKTGYRPQLWFCYHPYDKSPDWLGMEICRVLDIPMVTAEPCKTGQGPNGEWIPWRNEAKAGIKMAAMNIVMTPSDKAYLDTFIEPQKIALMPPFVDTDMLISSLQLEDKSEPSSLWSEGLRLLSVGMMRPGAKIDSYRLLANALQKLEEEKWSAVIVGSGPRLDEVHELFSWDEHARINIVGEKSCAEVLLLMEHAQVLAWPGCREAYGMVYLEAASRGCPVVALDNLGVPLVVEHERTGLLASPANSTTYAQCLKRLMNDRVLLKKLGAGAKQFVTSERSGEKTAQRLRQIIEPVLARSTQNG